MTVRHTIILGVTKKETLPYKIPDVINYKGHPILETLKHEKCNSESRNVFLRGSLLEGSNSVWDTHSHRVSHAENRIKPIMALSKCVMEGD